MKTTHSFQLVFVFPTLITFFFFSHPVVDSAACGVCASPHLGPIPVLKVPLNKLWWTNFHCQIFGSFPLESYSMFSSSPLLKLRQEIYVEIHYLHISLLINLCVIINLHFISKGTVCFTALLFFFFLTHLHRALWKPHGSIYSSSKYLLTAYTVPDLYTVIKTRPGRPQRTKSNSRHISSRNVR